MTAPGSRTDREENAAGGSAGLGGRLTAGAAALVIALVAGVPWRSAHRLLPDPDDETATYLGV